MCGFFDTKTLKPARLDIMIEEISRDEVLVGCRDLLGLSDVETAVVDDDLLTALVRRSAGIHCPCSRTVLRSSLVDALQYLCDSESVLHDRIEAIIEGLIVMGDLLELHDVGIVDPDVRGTWVFAAPPSYVERPDGEIFIIGIVADQDLFLPKSLASRVSMRGLARLILPEANEDLATKLDDQGLQRLSEKTWLRSPNAEPFGELLVRIERLLAKRPPAGTVNEMEILDGEQPVTFYRGRWSDCTGKTGIFVGRRPQEFGAPIWCLVELAAGNVSRFLDLPASKSRWRGCDEAWHVQMAIDARRGQPQRYRVQLQSDEWRFDFFSPLPAWSERRFIIYGRAVPREKCLMSYMLPSSAAKIDEGFLREFLWLSRTEE